MKKTLTFLFLIASFITGYSQVYTLVSNFGYQHKRVAVDSTLHIPTGCGSPTLKNSTKLKQAAIYYDTCNALFYIYNSKIKTWSTLKSDVNFWDTTSYAMYPNVSKYVGINNTTPTRWLDIKGTFFDSTEHGQLYNGQYNSVGFNGVNGNYATVQNAQATVGNYKSTDKNSSLYLDTVQRKFYSVWNDWHITEQTKYNDTDGLPSFDFGFKKTALSDYYRNFKIDTSGFTIKAIVDTNSNDYHQITTDAYGIKLQSFSNGAEMPAAIELNSVGVYVKNLHSFNDSIMPLLGSQFDSLQNNHLLIPNAKYYLMDRFELGIVLTAIGDSMVDMNARHKQYMPKYYTNNYYDDYGNIWRGVYNDSMLIMGTADTLNSGDLVVYGGRVWRSRYGQLQTPIDDFTLDTSFVQALPDTSPNLYVTKWFDIVYDDLHKMFVKQMDDKNNVLGYDYTSATDVNSDTNHLTRSDWNYEIIINNYAAYIINNRIIQNTINGNKVTYGIIANNISSAIVCNTTAGSINGNETQAHISRNICESITDNSVEEIADNTLSGSQQITGLIDYALAVNNNDPANTCSFSQTFSTPTTSYVVNHCRTINGATKVVLSATNSTAASHSFYVDNITDTTFTINVTSGFNGTATFDYIIK